MLIAVTGQKGSGKDTFADVVVAEWGYEKIMFAGTLKGMIKFLLMSAGLPEEEAESRINGHQSLKEEPLSVLQGQSTRFAMQKLGTEWRDFFGENLWTDIVNAKVAVTPKPILTDMRFPHEGDFVDEHQGIKVRVKRAGQPKGADLHISETQMESILVDYTIYNHGSLGDLKNIAMMTVLSALSGDPLESFAAKWDME